MESPNYYAIIPADVRYDKRLKPNAKLLYGEITSLTNKEGYCWAENSYFAELFEVSSETISRWISQLANYGYIDVELLQNLGNKRKIVIKNCSLVKGKKPLDKKVKTSCQNNQDLLTKKSRPLDKKVNSINENNKINNKTNREETPLSFLKSNFPSVFESLQMKYRQQITDFDYALEQADLKIIQERLEWLPEVLNARFQYFLNNWIRNNINKNNTTKEMQQQTNQKLPCEKRII